MIQTETWARNSFEIEAVRVTAENIRDVAEWCDGTIARLLTDTPKNYIVFGTVQYNKHSESKAFIGDWILQTEEGFKHYRDKSFRSAYQSKAAKREAVLEMVRDALGGVSYLDMDTKLTDQIMEFFGEG